MGLPGFAPSRLPKRRIAARKRNVQFGWQTPFDTQIAIFALRSLSIRTKTLQSMKQEADGKQSQASRYIGSFRISTTANILLIFLSVAATFAVGEGIVRILSVFMNRYPIIV